MDAIRMMLCRLTADRRGATAIEYGLLVALIAIAMVSGLELLGGGSNGMWTGLSNKVQNAT